ncbi:hypothetical protein MMMB2_4622 [Mycobacterium marinum MB2]|nr:hypothetical protein MMMB2_4622 [Mycobacterium marinum MB2]
MAWFSTPPHPTAGARTSPWPTNSVTGWPSTLQTSTTG